MQSVLDLSLNEVSIHYLDCTEVNLDFFRKSNFSTKDCNQLSLSRNWRRFLKEEQVNYFFYDINLSLKVNFIKIISNYLLNPLIIFVIFWKQIALLFLKFFLKELI